MRMISKFIIAISCLQSFAAFAVPLSEEGLFSGRVSRLNREIKTARIKVDFANIKYLNAKDKLEFWDERNDKLRCKSFIVARTAEYLLLKVPDLDYCVKNLNLTTGAYFQFYSEDLKNNILMGKEVVSILLKKRMAINGQMELRNKEIGSHTDKVGAVNARFTLLRTKLEEEWQKELHALDEDRSFSLRSYKDLERRRDEIDQKLELYKLKDENLTLDRWSLDPKFYYKK